MRLLAYLTLFMASTAHAKYRAYELVITSSETGTERIVVATLDPLLYRRYYQVNANEVVKYRATWMCFGNTSGLPICPKPEGK